MSRADIAVVRFDTTAHVSQVAVGKVANAHIAVQYRSPCRDPTHAGRQRGKDSIKRTIAGPTITTKSVGRMQNTVGKIIFNDNLAACSSTA